MKKAKKEKVTTACISVSRLICSRLQLPLWSWFDILFKSDKSQLQGEVSFANINITVD